jgi:hypothetical protein
MSVEAPAPTTRAITAPATEDDSGMLATVSGGSAKK